MARHDNLVGIDDDVVVAVEDLVDPSNEVVEDFGYVSTVESVDHGLISSELIHDDLMVVVNSEPLGLDSLLPVAAAEHG